MSDPVNLMELPPPPAPATVALWTGQIRTLIAIVSGIGLGGAGLQQITTDKISGYVTAIMTLVGLGGWAWAAVWSWLDKWKAAHAAHATAVASAVASAQETQAAGVPTAVVTTNQ